MRQIGGISSILDIWLVSKKLKRILKNNTKFFIRKNKQFAKNSYVL